MYKCPICKHNRNNKLHTRKCARIAKATLESITTAPKTDWQSLPTEDNAKFRKTLSGF